MRGGLLLVRDAHIAEHSKQRGTFGLGFNIIKKACVKRMLFK